LQIAAADPSIVRVTLSGAGPAFCAGGDLDEFGSAPDAATAHAVRMSQSACAVLDGIRDRVHVDVHGACVGAGIEIAACAGSVRARADAFFRLPELEMGLIPGAGGTASIARRVGRHRAAFLMLTGISIDSSQALRWGLIDEVSDAPG
jgi:enoyl-CoA hydratase/carnithine racemase